MALEEKRAAAERLYIQKSYTAADIAAELGVAEGTVYKWRAAGAREGHDWDERRRAYNLSPREMFAIYAEAIRKWVADLRQNPGLLADGKVADAISKHISAMKKIDPRSQYKGVALDLISVSNRWLAENRPELQEQMAPLWDGIFREMEKYCTSEGLF